MSFLDRKVESREIEPLELGVGGIVIRKGTGEVYPLSVPFKKNIKTPQTFLSICSRALLNLYAIYTESSMQAVPPAFSLISTHPQIVYSGLSCFLFSTL
jgi:hypothetical protein